MSHLYKIYSCSDILFYISKKNYGAVWLDPLVHNRTFKPHKIQPKIKKINPPGGCLQYNIRCYIQNRISSSHLKSHIRALFLFTAFQLWCHMQHAWEEKLKNDLERNTVYSLPTRFANEESKSLGSIFPECNGAPGLWIWVGGDGFSRSPYVQR